MPRHVEIGAHDAHLATLSVQLDECVTPTDHPLHQHCLLDVVQVQVQSVFVVDLQTYSDARLQRIQIEAEPVFHLYKYNYQLPGTHKSIHRNFRIQYFLHVHVHVP